MAFAITSVRQLPAPHGNDKANDKDTPSGMSIRLDNLVEAAKIIALRVYSAAMYVLYASLYVASFQNYAKAGENADDCWEDMSNGGGSLKLRLHRIANPNYVDEALEKIAAAKKKDKADPASKPHKHKKHVEKKEHTDTSKKTTAETVTSMLDGVKAVVDSGVGIVQDAAGFFTGNPANRRTVARKLEEAGRKCLTEYGALRQYTRNSSLLDPFAYKIFEDSVKRSIAESVENAESAYDYLADRTPAEEIAGKLEGLVQKHVASLLESVKRPAKDYLKSVKRGILEQFFDSTRDLLAVSKESSMLIRFKWVEATRGIQEDVADDVSSVREFAAIWHHQFERFRQGSAGLEEGALILGLQTDLRTLRPPRQSSQSVQRQQTETLLALDLASSSSSSSSSAPQISVPAPTPAPTPASTRAHAFENVCDVRAEPAVRIKLQRSPIPFTEFMDVKIRTLANKLNGAEGVTRLDDSQVVAACSRVRQEIQAWEPPVPSLVSRGLSSVVNGTRDGTAWVWKNVVPWPSRLLDLAAKYSPCWLAKIADKVGIAGLARSFADGISDFSQTVIRKVIDIPVMAFCTAGAISLVGLVAGIWDLSITPETWEGLAAVSLAFASWYHIPKYRKTVLWLSLVSIGAVNYLPIDRLVDMSNLTQFFGTVIKAGWLATTYGVGLAWHCRKYIACLVGGVYVLDALRPAAKATQSTAGKVLNVGRSLVSGITNSAKGAKQAVFG